MVLIILSCILGIRISQLQLPPLPLDNGRRLNSPTPATAVTGKTAPTIAVTGKTALATVHPKDQDLPERNAPNSHRRRGPPYLKTFSLTIIPIINRDFIIIMNLGFIYYNKMTLPSGGRRVSP